MDKNIVSSCPTRSVTSFHRLDCWEIPCLNAICRPCERTTPVCWNYSISMPLFVLKANLRIGTLWIGVSSGRSRLEKPYVFLLKNGYRTNFALLKTIAWSVARNTLTKDERVNVATSGFIHTFCRLNSSTMFQYCVQLAWKMAKMPSGPRTQPATTSFYGFFICGFKFPATCPNTEPGIHRWPDTFKQRSRPFQHILYQLYELWWMNDRLFSGQTTGYNLKLHLSDVIDHCCGCKA